MPVLQRLSPGPTIPDLMRATTARQLAGWRQRIGPGLDPFRPAGLLPRLEMRVWLALAEAILLSARVLLRLRLIEPGFAAGALGLASRLSDCGLASWSRYRRHRAARERSV